MTTARLIVSSLALGLAAPVIAQTTIEKLAPEDTVFIAGASNVNASMDRLKRTGLWELWQNDKMQAMWADLMESAKEGVTEALEDLGVEKDALQPPTGPVGIAVFPVKDEELGTSLPGFLLMAEYGENADKTAELIKAVVERGEKDGDIEVEQKDILGRSVQVITEIEKEEVEDVEVDAANGDDEEDMEFEFEEGPDPIDEALKTLHWVREGSSFLVSSNLDALTGALQTIDGKGEKNITDRQEYQAMLDKIGDHEAFAMLLTRDIMQLGGDDTGLMEMMIPMIRSALGHVKGYGMGVRLDGPAAMVEQTLTVYMPDGKVGLTDLVNLQTPRGDLPAFIAPSTVTCAAINFKFNQLMDTINKVVASNPLLQMQAAEGLAQADAPLRQITGALGTQVFIATSITRPLTATSSKGVFAVQCTNPQQFEDMLAGFAAQVGIEARDFLGQRIYTLPAEAMPMMMPGMAGGEGESMSIGIGGGFVMLGTTTSVEQALRSTSEAGAATLESDESFKRAVAALGSDPAVAWGYTDTINQMEAQLQAIKAQSAAMVEELREFAPEAAAEMEKENAESLKFFDEIDFDLLRKHIGPSVWRVQSIDDGFLMNSFTLAAAPK